MRENYRLNDNIISQPKTLYMDGGRYKISKKKRMKHLLVNINDFRKHKRDWLTTIKFYLISKLISAKEKRNVLSQAKNQAEAILKDNGLIVPFEVYLEDKKDKYFRTAAWYQLGSSEKGLVEIFIESHLIGKDIDRLVFNILHEYSHAIYEEVMLCGLGLDIVKIIELIRKYKHGNKYVPFYHHNVDEEKEDFCNFFADYLFNRKKYVKFKDEVEVLCNRVIQEYSQIHSMRAK
jgi:hypothetical protein